VRTPPDFEIGVVLRARKLATHIPPVPQTNPTGDAVSIEGEATRIGLPPETEPGGSYDDVLVEKRIVGELRPAGE
jgi:hypothetical protein